MINLEITSFAKILCKGLKQYLKNENIKINDLDFQELEYKLINEFKRIGIGIVSGPNGLIIVQIFA